MIDIYEDEKTTTATVKKQYDKVYVGNGREINSKFFVLSIEIDKITPDMVKTLTNGKKYLNLAMGTLKEPDEKRTHWIAFSKPQ